MKARLVNGLLTIFLVLGLLLPGCSIFPQDSADRVKTLISDIQVLKQKADDDGKVTVVIKLQGASLAGVEEEEVAEELKQQAAESQRRVLEFLHREDTTVLNTFWLTNAILAEVPVDLLDEFISLTKVERLFENFTVTIPEPQEEEDLPQVLSVNYTWGLERVRAPEVWDMGITGSGVRVAVLDTGVDISHPDLAGKMWTDDPEDPTYPGGWIEFSGNGSIVLDSEPYDSDYHGTHVSGTVLGGDASGIAIGVAPDAILMHGLVIPGGGGTFAQVVAGMEWAIDPFDQYGTSAGEPADVVSMSLGAYGYHDAMIEPVRNMKAAGIVLIAAIGNYGEGTSDSPGNVYEAFGIGATYYEDLVADSSGGEVVDWPVSHPEPYIKPDFSAPGVLVYSSVPGGYEYASGTSMATPHAAGTVALILEGEPALTVEDVYALLSDTAVDLGDEGQDTRYGWGRIDAFEAVSFLSSGIDGIVTDAETEEPLEGARIFVSETGQVRYSDDSGYYRFFMPPGTYHVTASAFGYYQGNATVQVAEDAFTPQDFALELMPTGFIAGTVTDMETDEPIEGAIVTLLDTPLSTNTSGTGEYSIETPMGTYNVTAWAQGYWESIALNVTVAQDETVTVDFVLEPALTASVLGDYDSQLTDLLLANHILAEERGWDIIDDIGDYNVVVVNCPSDPGESTFLEFLEAASDNQTGVVFTSSYPAAYAPYGISLLQWYLGDPAGQSYDYGNGDVYYQVTEEHPIFEGWEVGENVTIITGGWLDHAWFWDYSGCAIADIGSEYYGVQGNAVAVGEYGESSHVLLAGLAPQPDTNILHWTADARTIFINAVSFAARGSGIEGSVFDAVTEGSLEGAKISVSETGQPSYSDDSGYYRFFLPPGSYNLTASMFGYYEESAMVEVVEDAFTSQDFALAPMPTGFIAGTVTDVETDEPIEAAIVTLLDTPLSTNTSGTGEYSIEAPVGTYNVRAQAQGYRESTTLDVVVAQDETVTVNFALEGAPVVAVLGDYNSQLTELLWANDIWAEERGWDIIGDIALYDVVVVNLPSDPGESTFLEFLEAASDSNITVIFTSSWPAASTSYGISLLQWYLGDPAGQSYDYGSGDVYYKVTQAHSLFEGWGEGDDIPIITGGDCDHAWFWDYSGTTIAEVGSAYYGIQGDAVAVGAYGESLHVLLAGLAPQSCTNVPDWTEDAKTIFVRAVVMDIELGLAIETSELPFGFVDKEYQATLDATRGTEPYTWNITDGALPDGLDLNPTTGVISGTPTAADIFSFIVEVSDAEDNTAIASLALKVFEGCFIATAAYGTDTAQELEILRKFRDAVLLPNSLGTKLVSFYYKTSPPIANFISQHEVLRTVVRLGFVDPIVRMLTWTHGLWST